MSVITNGPAGDQSQQAKQKVGKKPNQTAVERGTEPVLVLTDAVRARWAVSSLMVGAAILGIAVINQINQVDTQTAAHVATHIASHVSMGSSEFSVISTVSYRELVWVLVMVAALGHFYEAWQFMSARSVYVRVQPEASSQSTEPNIVMSARADIVSPRQVIPDEKVSAGGIVIPAASGYDQPAGPD